MKIEDLREREPKVVYDCAGTPYPKAILLTPTERDEIVCDALAHIDRLERDREILDKSADET